MREEQNVTLQLRIPEKLVEQIDRYRENMRWTPTRSQMIRYLLEKGLVAETNESPIQGGLS